jgi:hypothetical protein
MARQPRTSQRQYGVSVRPAVKCAKCGVLTKDYQPIIIDKRPTWACRKDCYER